VAPADLQRAAALLAHALAIGRTPARVAPADPDRLELSGLACTARGMRATLQRDGAPVADVAIALHSRAGAQLWRALHAEHGPEIRGDPARPPAAPWCAVVPAGAGADAGELARVAAALALAFADHAARPLPPTRPP